MIKLGESYIMKINYIISIIIFILIYLIFYKKRLCNKSNFDVLKYSIMYIYLILVIYVTIFPLDFTLDLKWKYHSSINFTYIHLRPFNDLILGYYGALKEVILNIVMTIPFGFIYPFLLDKKVNIFHIIKMTFFLSFTIEFIQLLMTVFLLNYRSCDITDIITNVTGGVIGFILYKIVILKLKGRS